MPEHGDPARYLLNVRVAADVLHGVVFAAGAAALLSSGATTLLRDWTTALVGSAPAAAGLMVAFLVAVLFLVWLPVSWWADFAVPRRVGLSRLTPARFASMQARGLALGVPLGALAASALYALIGAAPEWWWLGTAVAMAVLSVLFSWVGPVLLLPVFLRSRPMEPGALRRRLERFIARAGLSIGGIYVAEYSSRTSAVNAFVTGLGNTRRITVSDTMLQAFTPAEVESVVAHEVAHHLNRDTAKGIAAYSALGLVAMGLAEMGGRWLAPPLGLGWPGDPAALPLFALLVGAVFTAASPLLNAMSRVAEYRADADSIRLAQDAESYLSSTRKLIDENLSVEKPPRWMEVLFFDHPAYYRRLRLGEEWRAGRAAGVGRGTKKGATRRRSKGKA